MKKWHKIALTVIAVVGILICIKSCIDKKNPDLTMAYIGNGFINRDVFDKNVGSLNELVNDIDSDGEININMMEISFSENLGVGDRQNANQKLVNAVGAGVARVYFMEEEYVRNNAGNGVFADLSQFGEGFKNPDGQVVAISIKGNQKVEKLGIDSDCDLYLAVRIVSEIDSVTDKNIEKKHQSAMNIAKYILS